MQTCDPLTAKTWFKLRTPVNLGIILVCFIPLVFVLQNLIYPLIADAVAVGLAFCAYYFVLDKRAIAILCPNLKCRQYIETNTPWKCGNVKCQRENERVDDFPFINRCQYCSVEQKAYKCHHCGHTIFFSEDKLKSICATCVELPVITKPKPAKRDRGADRISNENEAIRKTEYELRKAKLELQLRTVKKELEPEKELTQEEILSKSAKEFVDRNMSGAKIIEQLKAKNEKLFKNNPAELEKQNLLVDKWATNHLDDM